MRKTFEIVSAIVFIACIGYIAAEFMIFCAHVMAIDAQTN